MAKDKEIFFKELKETRMRIEAHYVVSIYKNIDMFKSYEINPSHFEKSNPWTFYYMIARNMIKKGGYEELDILSVDTYVDNYLSDAGKKRYKEFGGFTTVETALDTIEERNVESYYFEVLKYNALFDLHDKGFDIYSNWNEIKKLNYKELSDYINHTFGEVFVNAELGEDKVVDIKHGVLEMFQDADKGALRGIPYASKLINGHTLGMRRGELAVLAGKTGEGKTFLATNLVIPQLVRYKQKLLIICNEEDLNKWQNDIVNYLINDVISREEGPYKGKKLNKKRVREGNFSNEEWELIHAGIAKMEELMEDGLVNFINLSTFSMDKAIALINQYSSKYNVNYYILDTLKLDNDVGSDKPGDNSWLALQQASVKLYNTIKSNNQNAFVLLTYQLNKQNVSRLTLESLGMSKNIVDVASTVFLVRNLTNEEKEDGKLTIKRGGETKRLEEDDDYMVVFIAKNRAGESNKDIVLYTDKGHSIVRDVGHTIIPDTR